MHMRPCYLLTAGRMFDSINTPLCEGFWCVCVCVCVLHACAIERQECIVSGQSHMCSQRGIVVVQRCDDDLSNISRVSAVHSASFCCQNHFSKHSEVNRSSLVCVWGSTRMALHGSVTTGRFAGCQVHTVGINSIWTVSLQKQLMLSLLEILFEQIFLT